MCRQFHIEVERENGRACVKPVGELDLATVPDLEARLEELRAAAVRQVVLDLRGLTFMDSTGLSLTARWSAEAARDGFDFALVRGSGPIGRLFDLTGLDRRLPFVEPDG